MRCQSRQGTLIAWQGMMQSDQSWQGLLSWADPGVWRWWMQLSLQKVEGSDSDCWCRGWCQVQILGVEPCHSMLFLPSDPLCSHFYLRGWNHLLLLWLLLQGLEYWSYRSLWPPANSESMEGAGKQAGLKKHNPTSYLFLPPQPMIHSEHRSSQCRGCQGVGVGGSGNCEGISPSALWKKQSLRFPACMKRQRNCKEFRFYLQFPICRALRANGRFSSLKDWMIECLDFNIDTLH